VSRPIVRKLASTGEPSEQACGCWDDGEGFSLCDWHERRYRAMVDPAREWGETQMRRAEAAEADNRAIYGRMRHTHPDDVACATAGPDGHPPRLGSPERA
jgi:hypothetical protein